MGWPAGGDSGIQLLGAWEALLDHKTWVDGMIFRVQTRLTPRLFERLLLTSLKLFFIFLNQIYSLLGK